MRQSWRRTAPSAEATRRAFGLVWWPFLGGLGGLSLPLFLWDVFAQFRGCHVLYQHMNDVFLPFFACWP